MDLQNRQWSHCHSKTSKVFTRALIRREDFRHWPLEVATSFLSRRLKTVWLPLSIHHNRSLWMDFPCTTLLSKMRQMTGSGPTELPALETVHIAQVLQQLVRGYLCGSNKKTWHSHVFNYDNIPGQQNVLTYFYRFEFQQRGTLHLHLLVWLKNITKFSHTLIKADIPWKDPEMAYLVTKLQKSHKDCLPLTNTPSQFVEVNGKKTFQIYHPADEFALNLRAYITTVLPAIWCSMDFQMADGKSMVLKYVTSYVSK